MSTMEHKGGLSHNLVVLVVEDEFLVAMELESMLTEHGWRVLGPAATVATALALLEGKMPDAAVLDINLRGETVVPVAEVLRERGVPTVLASAYDQTASMADALAGVPNVGKPTQERHLLAALERAVET